MVPDNYKIVIREDKIPAAQRERRFNAPQTNEVTVVIVDNECEIRANKEIVLALASSGIAATLMDGGRTAHSGLKLLLNVTDYQLPARSVAPSASTCTAPSVESSRYNAIREYVTARRDSRDNSPKRHLSKRLHSSGERDFRWLTPPPLSPLSSPSPHIFRHQISYSFLKCQHCTSNSYGVASVHRKS
ncbi:hypothetical protein EVAR_63327_1 [Eumeta japonica]|uniref:ATP-dependent DNA helicase n=1 Tax=Eumeta variegata TaxID=151549 RepID=A0A4C1YPC9_EUMVA|nr:hypothetical protein EVAR_63327_1 [Eumeta japonica]